jgi:hypothetical protein
MRFLFGVIIGVGLTIGSAYVIDSRRAASGVEGPLVNWERVDSSWQEVRRNVRDTIRGLTS